MKSILLVILMLLTGVLHASVLHISPNGNDKNGNGSESNPYKSLSFALNKVSSGDTIFMDDGIYTEENQLIFPSNISLIGSGIDKSIVKSMFHYEIERWNIHEDKFLFYINNSHNICIKNFTLAGDSRKAYGGMFLDNTSNVDISEIKISDFNFCGIFWNNSVNIDMHNFIVENSAWPNFNGCSGSIMIGNIKNGAIHDGLVMEDSGYGIKTNIATWIHPHKLEAAVLENFDVYNIQFDMEPYGAWYDGMSPNFCLEYWNAELRNCRIFNCYFNTCISLPSSPRNKNGKTIEIFNNEFMMEFKPGVPSYAMEAGCPDMDIHHNYFKGGYYPLASFGKSVNGHKIHHNIFDDIWGISIIQHNGMENCRIENNTYYVRNDIPLILSKQLNNLVVSNNLFYCKEFYNHSKLLDCNAIDQVEVYGNWFYNWAPYGISYLEGNPGLKLSGRSPWEKYSPQRHGLMFKKGYIKGAVVYRIE